jgi:hypothetical protein
MDTISIILSTVIAFLLLVIWDFNGQIDRLKRRLASKPRPSLAELLQRIAADLNGKSPASIISDLRDEMGEKDAELNKIKFEYACHVAACKCGKDRVEHHLACECCRGTGLNALDEECQTCDSSGRADMVKSEPTPLQLKAIMYARLPNNRDGIKGKLEELGAMYLSKLKPEHFKTFKDYLLTLEISGRN